MIRLFIFTGLFQMQARERLAQLRALSKEYAKAKSQTIYLDHFRKSKLAILKGQFSEKNPDWANCKCEDAARSHPEYLELLKGWKEAIEFSEAAYWELSIARDGIKLHQTERADRRAELENLHGE